MDLTFYNTISGVRCALVVLLGVLWVPAMSFAQPSTYHWELLPGPNAARIDAVAAGPNGQVWTSVGYTRLYRSTNNGHSWIPVNNRRFIDTTVRSEISLIRFDSAGGVIVGLTDTQDSALLRTTDNGVTWQNLNYPLPECSSVVVAPDGTIIAGASEPESATGYPLFRSTDLGKTWRDSSEWNRFLSLSPDGVLYTVREGNVNKSTDNGKSWSYLLGQWDQFRDFKFLKFLPNGMWIGTHRHNFTYRSINDGKTWEKIFDYIHDRSIWWSDRSPR